jgi:hypothetical protein
MTNGGSERVGPQELAGFADSLRRPNCSWTDTMPMRWELDHVFIATPDPEFEAIASKFGFAFTDRRTHRGQGTTNACAPFENAFFELLFPAVADELGSDVVRPLGLRERIDWEQTGACPFGVCFRPTGDLPEGAMLPFETWLYCPAYVPPGSSVPIVTPPGHLLEPLLFLMRRPRAPASGLGAVHRGSTRTLTGIVVHTPHEIVSPSVKWFTEHRLVSVVHAPEYLLEIVWDHGKNGQTERLARPLPLAVSW